MRSGFTQSAGICQFRNEHYHPHPHPPALASDHDHDHGSKTQSDNYLDEARPTPSPIP